ncbi:hypothetical protein JCGZ_18229 [Jatropha curcas]|uniref:Uncharacterized protein n=1 Tax=Jatropha curcas TaxID=180498 RepID=A0A067K4Z9_JATCU|nr:hypothetical protein JCGZ_18229 [Jatropha curcas]
MRCVSPSPTPEDQQCVHLIKARGLLSVNLRQVIAEGYPVRSPSGPIRPRPSSFEMVPKNATASKMAKFSKAMKKKATEGRLDQGVSIVTVDPPTENTDAIFEPAYVELTLTSPSTEPSSKRPWEVTIPSPS